MRKIVLLVILSFSFTTSFSQSTYYFPAKTLNANWDTISPSSLGWCTNYIDTVFNYLDTTHAKAFIVLKGGKIALEHYTGTFTKDSLWYWASAGKTLVSFMTGIAQEEGLLSINDTSSKYLGQGWTNCTSQQEDQITVRNQLTMTTGLDDNVPNDDCTYDTCLIYKAPSGSRWAYHNAPYLLLQNVIQNASGVPFSQFTNTKIKTPTGMIGFWYDSTYYSGARDMARFGSLILNKGIWNQDTLMHDSIYFQQMTNTSQNINKSYGYLWWLNGKGSYMVPQSQLVFNTNLIPNAPADLIAALGKNDQKIYVIPSMDMVVVRMGDDAYSSSLALTQFDDILWGKLMNVFCNTTAISIKNDFQFRIYPNPSNEVLNLDNHIAIDDLRIFDLNGKEQMHFSEVKNSINISGLSPGIYFINLFKSNTKIGSTIKFIKLP